MSSPLGRLGSWSYRYRRVVVVAWLAALVLANWWFPRRLDRAIPDLFSETVEPSSAAAPLQRAILSPPVSPPAEASPRRWRLPRAVLYGFEPIDLWC
jgi:hypothetical protein